jgi:hypothetical protein
MAQRIVSTLEGPRQLRASTRVGPNGIYVDMVISDSATMLGKVAARCFRICPFHSQFRDMSDEDIANVALTDFTEGRLGFDIAGAISACRSLQGDRANLPGSVLIDWHTGESRLFRSAMAGNDVA